MKTNSDTLKKTSVGLVGCCGNIRKGVVFGVIFGAVSVIGVSGANATYIRHADTVYSSVGSYTGGAVENIIDKSGLEKDYINGVTDFDTYDPGNVEHDYKFWDTSTSTYTNSEWWASTSGTNGVPETGYLVFDLGDVFTIDRFAFWNEDGNGIDIIDISASVDGTTWGASLGSYLPTDNLYNGDPYDEANDYTADVFDLQVVTRYLRFDLTALDPGEMIDAPWLSIGEVAFSVKEPVPEPATMLLFGTGLLGLVGLGRKKMKHS